MTDREYLQTILKNSALSEDSDEIKTLRNERNAVEELLRSAFPDSAISIRYAGSYAKGTMNKGKNGFDLDMTCYFNRDDTIPGSSLEEIFESVKGVLSNDYYFVEPKKSALRLKRKVQREEKIEVIDFHIDVVPGRFVDESKTDTHLYQYNADKDYLKTNLNIHVTHVRDSELTETIRLAKLWRDINGLEAVIRTFILELLVIEVLGQYTDKDGVEVCFRKLLEEFRDKINYYTVADPANSNNDLVEFFSDSVKWQLSQSAKNNLEAIDNQGWESIFGPVEEIPNEKKRESVNILIRSAVTPIKPYGKKW